jgi:hypothetical protein
MIPPATSKRKPNNQSTNNIATIVQSMSSTSFQIVFVQLVIEFPNPNFYKRLLLEIMKRTLSFEGSWINDIMLNYFLMIALSLVLFLHLRLHARCQHLMQPVY